MKSSQTAIYNTIPMSSKYPASRLTILGKKLNIPSCASYIEFKNLGLHNQLSYFIKRTRLAGSSRHGDGELNNIQNI